MKLRTRIAFQHQPTRKMFLDVWKKMLLKEGRERRKEESLYLRSLSFYDASPRSPSLPKVDGGRREGEREEERKKGVEKGVGELMEGRYHFLLSKSNALNEAISHYLLHFPVSLSLSLFFSFSLSLSFLLSLSLSFL